MTVRILVGDVRARLLELAPDSVDMCMSSPPYWGLRSYGTEPQVWGGDADCAHDWTAQRAPWANDVKGPNSGGKNGDRYAQMSKEAGGICLCGAWRGEHGMEPALEMWLENEVLIWREVRRVLRKDGTLWLNCGDSYATKPAGWSAEWYRRNKRDDRTFRDKPINTVGRREESPTTHGISLASKQRLMLPARLAIALQDDGWILRDEIVWHKPNPMPSSVEDRTTPAHEMLYLFAKSNRTQFWHHRDRGLEHRIYKRPAPDYRWRNRKTGDEQLEAPAGKPEEVKATWVRVNLWEGHDYYFDGDAIAETASPNTHARISQALDRQGGGAKTAAFKQEMGEHFGRGRTQDDIVKSLAAKRVAGWVTEGSDRSAVAHAQINVSGNLERKFGGDADRPDSHIGRSIPWTPGLGQKRVDAGEGIKANDSFQAAISGEVVLMRQKRSVWSIPTEPFPEAHFATFPTALVEPCIKAGCPAGGTVLDPFGGSGTTAVVAERLGRNAVLIELNPVYAEMAERRIKNDAPLLNNVSREERRAAAE